MRFFLALWACKFITFFLRILRRGGTALPGKVALRLCPDILTRLAGQFTVYCVTGTNGKTTTAIFMSSILERQGKRYISNRSGSNLERGIVACFAEGVNLRGRSRGAGYAVIECDEAAFAKVAGKMQPAAVVVTNFFKDQLDRYGEVTHTRELIRTGLSNAPGAAMVLNADDQLCASLGRDLPNKAVYYGADNSDGGITDASNSANETGYCLYCQTPLDYAYTTYGHLGGYSCPSCGFARPRPDIEMRKLRMSVDSATFDFAAAGREDLLRCSITMPGVYNVYNALAALAFGLAIGADPEEAEQAIGSCEPGFGRMEAVQIGGSTVRTILVKNPMGFNQVINYLIAADKPMRLCFAINDNYADGVDISWLWDVNFERLEAMGDRLRAAYVCGMRGPDMAVRLKYAGLESFTEPLSDIEGEASIEDTMERAIAGLREGEDLVILPTYTSMLRVRRYLQGKAKMKEFWK